MRVGISLLTVLDEPEGLVERFPERAAAFTWDT